MTASCAKWKRVVPLTDETWGRAKRKRERGGAPADRGAEMMERGEAARRVAEHGCIGIHLTDKEVLFTRPPAFSLPLSSTLTWNTRGTIWLQLLCIFLCHWELNQKSRRNLDIKHPLMALYQQLYTYIKNNFNIANVTNVTNWSGVARMSCLHQLIGISYSI